MLATCEQEHGLTPESAAECVADAVVRAQLKLGSTVERQLVRRCDLLTPPESVVSYPENQKDGD
jgi:hypothetical protein